MCGSVSSLFGGFFRVLVWLWMVLWRWFWILVGSWKKYVKFIFVLKKNLVLRMRR